ncbi:MAG: flagellar hook assembly protein FlgD [Acidovorax sp.]|jgi:flagellar basal-body rod modification protein FlgD|nr:flagellar hook assembly protein FlgD [Acidovorax sp.]MDR3004357.1 flagellar hook assembly protein FlgD [Acidovorax sp.]
MINGVNNNTSSGNGTSSTKNGTSAAEMQDKFLTLLVAQLKNQDPTNPMDNAQLTSQMAQISTVSGIEKLNDTVSSVTSQFSQMQMLQGSSLIGHTVLTEGNGLALTDKGEGTAAFELAGKAANVTVTITNGAGELVDTVELSNLNAGRNYFTWDGSKYEGDKSNLHYNVKATNASSVVKVTPLTASNVVAATVSSGKLVLELGNGTTVDYNKVQSVF